MWESIQDFIFGTEDKLLRINDWRNITETDINFYLQQGAEVTCTDADGWSVLMQAAAGNARPSILRYLVELGADPDAQNDFGLRAWNYANNEICANVIRQMSKTAPKTVSDHNDMPPLDYDGHIRN